MAAVYDSRSRLEEDCMAPMSGTAKRFLTEAFGLHPGERRNTIARLPGDTIQKMPR